MQIDLQRLHAAGAEIIGHAEAWLALGQRPTFANDRRNIYAEVGALHQAKGRRILPVEITNPKA